MKPTVTIELEEYQILIAKQKDLENLTETLTNDSSKVVVIKKSHYNTVTIKTKEEVFKDLSEEFDKQLEKFNDLLAERNLFLDNSHRFRKKQDELRSFIKGYLAYPWVFRIFINAKKHFNECI